MTIALVAADLFGACFELSYAFLHEHGYIQRRLSKSRFNRRLHAIPEWVWRVLMDGLSQAHQQMNDGHESLVDSLPVPVCDNIRIRRCRLYRGDAYRGWIASKRRYFYGLRIHLLTTATGQPIEFVLAPGAAADIAVFKTLHLDLPPDATIYADKAYTDYVWEDLLAEAGSVHLVAMRRSNALRKMDGCLRYICQKTRKQIECSFNQVADRFARCLRAVTPRCFELKVCLCVLAFAI